MDNHDAIIQEIVAAVRQMLQAMPPSYRGPVQVQVAAALVQDVAYDAQMVPSRTLMIQLLTSFIDLERAARDMVGQGGA